MTFQIGPNMDREWIRSLGIDTGADGNENDISVKDLEKNRDKISKEGPEGRKRFYNAVKMLFNKMHQVEKGATDKFLKELEGTKEDEEILEAANVGLGKAVEGQRYLGNIKVELKGNPKPIEEYGIEFSGEPDIKLKDKERLSSDYDDKKGQIVLSYDENKIQKLAYCETIMAKDIDNAIFKEIDIPQRHYKTDQKAEIRFDKAKDTEKVVVEGLSNGCVIFYRYYKEKDGQQEVEIMKFYGYTE